MCGLSGFVCGRARAEPLGAIVTRMNNAIAHRGPDDSGVWIDENIGLSLGHRRLSILDLSPAGHQPLQSA